MKTLILYVFLISPAFAIELSDIKEIQLNDSSTCTLDYKIQLSLISRVMTVQSAIDNISANLNVNPCLIFSITKTESNFKAHARSHKNAQGLMQVLPSTRKEVLKNMKYEFNKVFTQNLNSTLHHAELEDLIVGSFYVKTLIRKFDYNLDHAIIAYNMGPRWVNKQLNARLIIGNKNQYLNKVKSSLSLISYN